jgi:hypothetical protein
MTVKALINELQAILDKRGGKDLLVMLDVDFEYIHKAMSVICMDDLTDMEDHALISSTGAVAAGFNWEDNQEIEEATNN